MSRHTRNDQATVAGKPNPRRCFTGVSFTVIRRNRFLRHDFPSLVAKDIKHINRQLYGEIGEFMKKP